MAKNNKLITELMNYDKLIIDICRFFAVFWT